MSMFIFNVTAVVLRQKICVLKCDKLFVFYTDVTHFAFNLFISDILLQIVSIFYKYLKFTVAFAQQGEVVLE